MIRAQLQRIRDRSFILLTLNYIVAQIRYRLGERKHLSGATHAQWSAEEGLDYVLSVFADYLEAGGLTIADLRGMSVLEVGPGDNLGVAACFAAAGARRVVCIDRFDTARDEQKNRAVYRLLACSGRAPAELDFRDVITPVGELISPIIEHRVGLAIEKAVSELQPGSFDLIVSRAVLEHVSNLEQAWASMDALLTSGGLALHKVDFRNHGLYASLHPLRFLTVPTGVWRWVSAPDPTLNRRRVSTYEQLAGGAGYRFRIGVTHLASREAEFKPPRDTWINGKDFTADDVARIEAIRPKLVEPFRSMSLRELLISGIFLAAQKST